MHKYPGWRQISRTGRRSQSSRQWVRGCRWWQRQPSRRSPSFDELGYMELDKRGAELLYLTATPPSWSSTGWPSGVPPSATPGSAGTTRCSLRSANPGSPVDRPVLPSHRFAAHRVPRQVPARERGRRQGWRALPGRDDQPGPRGRQDRAAAGPRRQRLLRQPVHRRLPSRRGGVQRDRPHPRRAVLRQERARRPKAHRLAADPRLHDAVADGLKEAWSPRQISARLRVDHPADEAMRVSHEKIYESLHLQARGEFNTQLKLALRTGRTRRAARAACRRAAHRCRLLERCAGSGQAARRRRATDAATSTPAAPIRSSAAWETSGTAAEGAASTKSGPSYCTMSRPRL